MRGLSKSPVLVGVSLLAILVMAVAVGCSETEEATSGDAEAEPMSEQTEAKTATEVEEGTDAVTATLTMIPEGKAGTDAMTQTDVAYLAPGRKVATLETTKGDIKIELWEDMAPNTVVNFVHLANSGRYDGVDFHRVIPGFMAQTGDVQKRGGYGGPGYSIPAEFNNEMKHVRGVVSMARSGHPDSAGSQFFIMFGASPHLDGQYAAFGKVIEGMDVVDSLNTGEPPASPDKIVKARVESVPAE